MIARKIATSEKLGQVSIKSALLYTWMTPFLDDFGCYYGDAPMHKRFIVPKRKDFTTKVIENCLKELASIHLINLYEVDGFQYLEQLKFDEFQTLKSDRRMIAEFPPPPQGYANWKDNGNQLESNWKPQDKVKEKIKDKKEILKKEIDDAAFESFWKTYPRHVDKGKAHRAWEARAKEGTMYEDMIAAAKNYSTVKKGEDDKFIKHAATFLGPDRPFTEWVNGIPEGERKRDGKERRNDGEKLDPETVKRLGLKQ
jgi:hypothetical protein